MVVSGDEAINGVPQLAGGGEARAPERGAAQDPEAALDLIEQRAIGGIKCRCTLGWPVATSSEAKQRCVPWRL
jgi:hypothetical protein